MLNTKLIRLIKTLSTSEFREFKDFVNSPVFNKNKKVIALLGFLKEFYPEFGSEKLTQEIAFKKIFPGEKFDYYKIKNIISDLLKLGKEYLAFLSYRDLSSVNEKFLLEQLRERNLDHLFEQAHKAFGKNLEKSVVKDEDFILKSLDLIEESHSFQIPKDPDSRLEFFQKELDHFLTYSIIRLLKYYNIMLHEKQQNNYKFNMKMFDEIMDYLKKNPDQDNPTLLIYYNIILLVKEVKEKYFFELKKLKDKHFEQLNSNDRYMLFLHMASYCAYVFNMEGRTDFMREHFLLSKENYDRGTIILGKMLYPDFLNHVKIAVRVDEYEWAEMYINEFNHLLTEEKESTLNFCYGYINYRKGNLDKAMELFSKTNFPNFLIKLQVKIILLQIYFEKGFYEQAFSMIDAFRHYITREKSIVDEYKESFYNYLRIINEFIKLKTSFPTEEINYNIKRIKIEIEKIKINQFGIKNWLKEKADEMIIK